MSIRNAGKLIHEARIKAGLSQEKLSDGVCSSLSLSRIENGSAGVSPSTFQALMTRAGAPCEIYPIFANRRDFDCFYTLKRVRFYLSNWKLQHAYNELNKVEKLNWADHQLYYQEWLFLHCKLQFCSGSANHQELYEVLVDSLHITRPDQDISDFRNLLLSITEIEILIAIAGEALYINNPNLCLFICTQITTYLTNTEITYLEKERLNAENAIVYIKYLLLTKDYATALSIAKSSRYKIVSNAEDGPLFELTFLTSLSYYYTNQHEYALTWFQVCFFSAYSIDSYYATLCRNYILNHTTLVLPDILLDFPDIPYVSYPIKKARSGIHLTDGSYDLFSPDVLTLGKLIHDLRIEQGLSQTVLCQGLCSKSKLSKIENCRLQPDIFLVETLLQRLGLSEREFIFIGNEEEAKIHELKNRIYHHHSLPKEEFQNYLDHIQLHLKKNDHLLYQFYLLNIVAFKDSVQEKLNILFDALNCTLPNFNISNIHAYRLSWIELSILNNIAYEYRKSDTPNIGYLYSNKIIEYFNLYSPDILLQTQILCHTLFMYCENLYKNQHFHEILDLLTDHHRSLLKNNLYVYGDFLFYYSQSLAECSHLKEAMKYGRFSYYINLLYENENNARKLEQALYEDFNLTILN